jgi:hypothetical protein
VIGSHHLLEETLCRGNVMLEQAFIDFRGITPYPAKHSRVVHIESALFHHLFNASIRELVAAVPADTKWDDIRRVVTPFERRGFIIHEET